MRERVFQLITVVEQTTSKRKREMEDKWLTFKELYYNSNLPASKIYKKIGVHYTTETRKYITQKCKEEKMNVAKRGKLIQYNRWLK